MGKVERRFPGTQATCLRCGAPASPFRGGRLVPVKGLRLRTVGPPARPHRRREWQHADPAFCDQRVPHVRRTPTSRDTNTPDVKR